MKRNKIKEQGYKHLLKRSNELKKDKRLVRLIEITKDAIEDKETHK